MNEKYVILVGGSALGFVLGLLSVALGVIEYAHTSTEVVPAHTNNHAMQEVDTQAPVPTVTIEAFEDMMDGFNLKIDTEHFTFTPEQVNTEPRFNEGHAHLYVNGVKITRLYSPWVHLSAKHLDEGSNLIEVTLNANDHSEWANEGEHIQATLMLEKK